MRDSLNAILAFIGSESLTDEEFEALTIEDMSDMALVYADLLVVLETRESVSTLKDKLMHYFLAKGVAVGEPDEGQSNIFVGGPLCS